MNLKELIKDVERLKIKKEIHNISITSSDYKLQGIKQTVEAVNKFVTYDWYAPCGTEESKDWQKLKELLGLK